MLPDYRLKIWLALLFCFAITVPGFGAAVAATDDTVIANKLVVGVRADAPPFSYNVRPGDQRPAARHNGPLHSAGYAGFMVALCDLALVDMQFVNRRLDVQVVEVKAGDRFKKLISGDIDILCDPATITEARLENDFGVSPPVYLSGISLLALDPEFYVSEYCGAIVGFVGSTTVQTGGITKIVGAGEFGRFTSAVNNVLAGGEPNYENFPDCSAGNRDDIVKLFPDHRSLAEAFCAGKVIYYVGDVEIITRNVQRHKSCRYSRSGNTYSDERYGVFTRALRSFSADNAPVYHNVLQFERTLNRLLYSQRSIIVTAFREYFPNYRVSEKLRIMILSIYGIDLK